MGRYRDSPKRSNYKLRTFLVKSTMTQHPFQIMDRLLEKAQGPNPGLFRYLESVL